MDVIRPGQHGSTFGGNPIAAKVATAALEVAQDEKLAARSRRHGSIFREEMNNLKKSVTLIREVRGKGLLNEVEIDDSRDYFTAWDICLSMMENGRLAKSTQGNNIRL